MLLFFLKPHYRTSGDIVFDYSPEVAAEVLARQQKEIKRVLKLRHDLEAIIDGKKVRFRDGDIVTDADYELVLLMMVILDD